MGAGWVSPKVAAGTEHGGPARGGPHRGGAGATRVLRFGVCVVCVRWGQVVGGGRRGVSCR